MPKVDFVRSRDGLTLRDSIVLTDAEAASWALDDYEAEADRRFEAYVERVNNPPPDEPEE